MATKTATFDDKQDSYLAFRNIVAERTSSIIAWIGSGLSRPAGLPTWLELRLRLCDVLQNKAASFEHDKADLIARHDLALAEPDLWVAFEILKKALGSTTYRETIRSALKPGETASIPESYKLLCQLPLGGILNLNLDRLATRAFSETHPGRAVNEFLGKNAGENAHLLKSPHTFIGNLHGITTEESSWVFTRSDLKRIQRHTGYVDLIRACLTTRTILFIGISADDVAAGGYLATLADMKIDTGCHYWITHRVLVQPDLEAWLR